MSRFGKDTAPREALALGFCPPVFRRQETECNWSGMLHLPRQGRSSEAMFWTRIEAMAATANCEI
jgi:hypothetical protein